MALADFDLDGDLDIVAGNWGNNTRLTASTAKPIELYRVDLDDNGTDETILLYFYNGKQTLVASKDELGKQVPSIKKKFLSYRDFAAASMDEIFPKEKLKNGMRKEVKVLSSCYFENSGNNTFKLHSLPWGAQHSTVNDIFIDDFNKDGFPDILLVGNNYEVSTQIGRLDASHGKILLNDKAGFFSEKITQNFNIAGPARKIGKVRINSVQYLIVTINNDGPVFLKTL